MADDEIDAAAKEHHDRLTGHDLSIPERRARLAALTSSTDSWAEPSDDLAEYAAAIEPICDEMQQRAVTYLTGYIDGIDTALELIDGEDDG